MWFVLDIMITMLIFVLSVFQIMNDFMILLRHFICICSAQELCLVAKIG